MLGPSIKPVGETMTLWLRAVADALAAARRLGIVRRDLRAEQPDCCGGRDLPVRRCLICWHRPARSRSEPSVSNRRGHTARPTTWPPSKPEGERGVPFPTDDVFALACTRLRLLDRQASRFGEHVGAADQDLVRGAASTSLALPCGPEALKRRLCTC